MDHTLDPSQAHKLTSWAKEPSLLQLKQDFEMAKPSHDSQMTKINGWNDMMFVRGTAAPKKVKGRSSVQPKLIRRQAEWRYSALSEPFLGSNKLYKIDPVSWEDEESAKQNELVLNWQFRTKINRVKFIDDYVRSTVDEGTSVLRVGWCRNTVKVKQKAPVYTYFRLDGDEQVQQFQEALQLRNEDPHTYSNKTPAALQEAIDYYDETGEATYAVQTSTQVVVVDKVVENRPTVEVINPQNFYLDPTCNGDLSKALFAIVSFETNQAELKKYPERYKNLHLVNWETSTPVTATDHASNTTEAAQFRDLARKKVVAYEYWGFYDVEGDGVLVPVVCTWIGDTIIRMERNPFPDQALPFVLVPYLPVKRDAFGEPDAELLEDNQKILGAVTRGMIDLLGKSANGQRGMSKGMLDALNKRKYEAGDDYEFNPNQNPTNGIIEHKFPELPQSAMVMLNLQNAEAEALTGVKSFSGGMSGNAYGDTATGAKGVMDAAAKREMSILRRLAQGMCEVGNKFTSMNAAFLSEKEVVRVTNAQYVQLSPSQQSGAKDAPSTYDTAGQEEKNKFITVNREDLAGNFDLIVDISTAEVDAAKAQDLSMMTQTIGPNAPPGVAMMLMAEIADLKRMPALAHRLRTYKPEPDPMEEQLKQLALKKAELEIEELRSSIALNNARAAEASSKKDKNDLDYVEQETGTKHARDLDRQGAQARGNQDLTVTKALLAPRKPDQSKPDIEAAVGYNELTQQQAHSNTLEHPALRVDTPIQTPPLQAEAPVY
jgi:hypothetical protein